MRTIAIRELKLDMAIFPRQRIDDGHIESLIEASEAGAVFPPLVVCQESLRVIDGFHRYKAYVRRFGLSHQLEIIEKRYRDDRELFLDAVRLNAAHGKPLSNADKQSCAKLAVHFGITSGELGLSLNVREQTAVQLMSVKPSKSTLTVRGSYRHKLNNHTHRLSAVEKPLEGEPVDMPSFTGTGIDQFRLDRNTLQGIDYKRSPDAMEADIAAAVATRVMIHLFRGTIEQARAALEDGWKSHVANLTPLPIGESLRDEPLSKVMDDLRLINKLEDSFIFSVGDLLDAENEMLESIRDMGPGRLGHVRRLRAELGRRAGEQQEIAG